MVNATIANDHRHFHLIYVICRTLASDLHKYVYVKVLFNKNYLMYTFYHLNPFYVLVIKYYINFLTFVYTRIYFSTFSLILNSDMSSLYKDSRLYFILGANSLSAIGSGIVMITIPWLLIKESRGETTFGYVSIISTLIMFLLTPFIGQSIDRFSRKSLLLCNEGIGIAVIGIMVIWGFAGQSYHSIHYILIYIAGSFYYLLFYPTIFAFNQEIFQAEHYKSLSGTMEIQGQLTQVISGAAASFLIEVVSLKWILLVDMLTFAGAFLLFLCIPYVKKKEIKKKITFKKQLFEGIHFMKNRPKLFWFLLATYMPFIGVMMANYLIPVYISDILKANASVYAYLPYYMPQPRQQRP
ncbi:Macrolide efflux protein [Bacillus cereus]|nr:Macrolide efflux protein [Bacillus cereus]